MSGEWEYVLRVPLPDGTSDDPYDQDELANVLREVADKVADRDVPPTGELWDRRGRLLAIAALVEDEEDEA